MSHEWEEIPIEDVQPGDVARCNGREFRVEAEFPPVNERYPCIALPGYGAVTLKWPHFDLFGFTFWRKVKREPLSTMAVVDLFEHQLYAGVPLPSDWAGRKVRITEILDGEDGS